ncbi:MAG: tol-pal system protein YbgF [Pseudomonadota bacterium]
MMRNTLVLLIWVSGLIALSQAHAQNRQAQIVQGMTSGELAATVEELRFSNAELRARMTGLESDKARLNGKVETLEFLLSESRDEINRIQSDNAQFDVVIGQLETRLADQQDTIQDLTAQIQALQPEPAFLSSGLSAAPATPNPAITAPSELPQDTPPAARPGSEPPATAGPTRIVRQTDSAASGTDIVQLGPDGQPLPQGSLGTMPASALPGDAGPLFAEAKSRLLRFDYSGAEQAFRSFLTQFGDDPQAGEAQYWLAEVLYQQEAYPESGAAYTDMIRNYPDDPRAPVALAKLARSMRLVGDTEQACNALDLLPQRYPNASGVTQNLAAGERVRSGCDT